ncbi:dTDP-4-dehydrorhamnose reductase [Lacihabitans lacunae]|uniref:dTDP-4-dehydrorhamnose reductase n=1 Tax=Lacihabitans lacunae TaxID=1028214 RepID=A0ABV7YU89_9BACT
MRVLVLGGNGQLGQCLAKVSAEYTISHVFFADEIIGNILDQNILNTLFTNEEPDFVINCAAYTAVDKAEDEIELAKAINETGAKNVAEVCKAFGATLIHISTDFVFEGNIPALLDEENIACPISVYGSTKLEGEHRVAEVLDNYYILRTSWLYSEFAGNFMKTMLRLANDRTELSVIVDQIGTPTYGVDLARAIFVIITSNKTEYGLYHYSNEGAISWFDFASAIFEISNISIKLNPIKTSEYITKAKRPAFSAMDKSKIKTKFNLEIPYWRESLKISLKS